MRVHLLPCCTEAVQAVSRYDWEDGIQSDSVLWHGKLEEDREKTGDLRVVERSTGFDDDGSQIAEANCFGGSFGGISWR